MEFAYNYNPIVFACFDWCMGITSHQNGTILLVHQSMTDTFRIDSPRNLSSICDLSIHNSNNNHKNLTIFVHLPCWWFAFHSVYTIFAVVASPCRRCTVEWLHYYCSTWGDRIETRFVVGNISFTIWDFYAQWNMISHCTLYYSIKAIHSLL